MPSNLRLIQGKQIDVNLTGSFSGSFSGSLFGTASYAMNGGGTTAFLRNKTNDSSTDVITVNQSIFNPSNLNVLDTSIFIIESEADYYILGDLINSGSVIVDGTLKVGGEIYNQGTITGTGIIE